MIQNCEQPKKIFIDDTLALVKYYPYYRRTLSWYQDLELCRQVDNRDSVYDLPTLSRMYRFLCRHGECYYLKFFEKGRWHLVGDITLRDNGEIAIVICREYQNRHLGRKAVRAILHRAKEIGFSLVEAEIYSFNMQSQKMFLSLGFKQTAPERFQYTFI